MPRASGFTLWELLCALAIAALILGSGVPALRGFLLDAELTADVNALVLAVQLARSEAVKRGQPVVVCGTPDRVRCGGALDSGWMVFVNLDEEQPPRLSGADALLFVHDAAIEGSIESNRPFFEFRVGRRSTNGTVVFCDARGSDAARAVVVSYTGRPRVDRRDGSGRPLRCAGLT
jgi:type IV fimbrial biogenesis protein FimT